jgi:hypothetical protein
MSGLDLDDFVDFFGGSPVWTAANGWYYGAKFLVEQGGETLTVTIAPDEAECTLSWTRQGRRLLALELRSVLGWKIEARESSRHLLLRVNTGPDALSSVDYCLIRVKPMIEVDMSMNWGPGWDPSGQAPAPHFRST